MSLIAPTLQSFFTERLTKQRRVSPKTIASYRDSLKLLFVFVQQRTGKPPTTLDWTDLDADTISAFLQHLETDRHNSARTRNLRLTAIRSLFTYAAIQHPEHADLIQRVLAIPAKRFDKPLVSFLTTTEIDALIEAPDRTRWEGRRDRALLLLAVQTGLRVTELTDLDCGDIGLGTGAHLRCLGKGRRHRAVPLTSPTQAVLRVWMTERAGHPSTGTGDFTWPPAGTSNRPLTAQVTGLSGTGQDRPPGEPPPATRTQGQNPPPTEGLHNKGGRRHPIGSRRRHRRHR